MTTPVNPSDVTVDVSATKTVVAAIGATVTAVSGALTTVSLAVNDGQLDGGEITGLVSTLVSLGLTVYGVWKTRNQVLAIRAK